MNTTREQRILGWLVLIGAALISLSFGQKFFEEATEYGNRETAQWCIGLLGVVLIVAAFVLREVFRSKAK